MHLISFVSVQAPQKIAIAITIAIAIAMAMVMMVHLARVTKINQESYMALISSPPPKC